MPPGKLPCDLCWGRDKGICGPLEDQRLRQLLQTGGRRRWAKRQFLYRADDPIQAFYKITKGIVVESRTLVDGRRQIVGIRSGGDLCGYPAQRGQHLSTAQALTEVEGCAFDARTFDAVLRQHGDLASALVQEVSDKLRRTTESMVAIGQLNSVERVAHFLVEMSELQGLNELTDQTLFLHLTRQEIADYLGLTLETISRALTKLREMQVIASLGINAVAILHKDGLRGLTRR
jgi:CRP/FNR family transcriptional regulator